ncbi:MAG TPA: CotH kinase family protein, partial [Verrucomicrobiae bacterium]|nr:CotH kinase family protein [Verrucomicrobiae bacterium]
GLSIRLTGLTPGQDYYLTIWSYDNSSTGGRVSDWIETASGTTRIIATAYNFDGSIVPTQDGHDTFGNVVRSSPEGVLQIEGRRHGGTSHGVFLNALQLVQLGYGSLIATDTGAAMTNQNASAYLRIPFTVTDPSALQTLSLRMKYDDGFVAYLNGQEVASRNAPASPQWNSAATASHPNADALVFEEITLADAAGLLQTGPNVLTIQGLNVSAADGDFLIVPELQGIAVDESAGLYLKPPTPGAPNGPGYAGFVADTKFSVDRGFFDLPFTVAITSATASAVIRWTTDGSPPTETTGAVYTGPIMITNTTYLRAAAFKSGLIPSDVDTHTYLFLDQVIRQPNEQPGFPTIWQGSYPADYGMDPNVVNSANYGSTIKDDLRSIPTLSIVTTHDNLWHPTTGIYNNATSEGAPWERAASLELIDGDGTTEFAVNAGIQMQGNASRDNARTPKHAIRLLFKSIYGPGKLNYDWFPGPVEKFNTIVLRACFTDSWSTRYSDSTTIPGGRGTRYRPEDSLLLRDVWVKDCLADMGWLSGRGDFVHLYLNGLYWGLYNPSERLDETYFEEHVGGREEDWDVIRDFSEVLAGSKSDWDQMMALVNAGITSEAAYQAVEALVDIDNLIDFMMIHIFAEAEDWPHHNWYAAHRRAGSGLPATKWVFLSWDQEIVLDQLVRRNRIDVNNNDTPARIYSQLRAYPEFRRRFGDRLQKHLFNGGALTPEQNIARLQARVSRVHRAMVGESARWGDAR